MTIIRNIPWTKRPPTGTPFRKPKGMMSFWVFDGDRAWDVLGNSGDLVHVTNAPGRAMSSKWGRGTRFTGDSDTRLQVAVEADWAAIHAMTGNGTVMA